MSSMLLRTAMRLLFPLTLIFGVYMAVKGHNEPGGGFIGGLILATALALYRMAAGPASLWEVIPVHPRLVVAAGLGFATLAALAPLLLGRPLLTTWTGDVPLVFGETVHLASALVFDLGVLLTVIGVSVGMITRLSEFCEDLPEEPEPHEAEPQPANLPSPPTPSPTDGGDHP